ncbi:hypothetical protein J5N97_017267 [Dioscorea zingiberensis]|uniref:S-adenosyl-L-methionine-dependent methyltransferase n=1 Tax=Dioscorea zingiberensis TaxID=325984 RepID=A0A9D5HGE9_9LILI|nr:hypothetical protein J5N97_017267 [Dioscorea zingiberensis]
MDSSIGFRAPASAAIAHQWRLPIPSLPLMAVNPIKQARLRTMASLSDLASGNHHPDPLLQAALRSASLRFQESHRPACIMDPYASCFLTVNTTPPSASTPYRLATKFIDDELLDRMSRVDDLRQVVLLTDGMDTRPFRLNWQKPFAIYDVSPGSVFQFASQRLEGIGAKMPRTCMLLHVPSESSNIQELLCEKGFNGNRPSFGLFSDRLIDQFYLISLQGLPLMTFASLNDVLFLVSSLAMKGCVFLGELPGWLIGTEFGNMAAAQKWLESLFMSHGFQVRVVDYAEVARKVNLDPPTEEFYSVLFVAEQLRFSDAQMERWRLEFQRLEVALVVAVDVEWGNGMDSFADMIDRALQKEFPESKQNGFEVFDGEKLYKFSSGTSYSRHTDSSCSFVIVIVFWF